MKKKNGFTLIELLAVIIILGVLMIIAIPSVTRYIDESRKSGYVSTAKSIVGGARNLVHSGELDLDDKTVTYYIDGKCINTDNGYKSPYGELEKAYVAVVLDGDNYEYYWMSVDDTNTGVATLKNANKLDSDDIVGDIDPQSITPTIGIDKRNTIIKIEGEGCTKSNPEPATRKMNTKTGKVSDPCPPVTPTIYWAISNNKLTISDSLVNGSQMGNFSGNMEFEYHNTQWLSDWDVTRYISEIEIVGDVVPASVQYWFDGAGQNASTFRADMTNLNVCNVTSFNRMFGYSGKDASTWEVIGLGDFDTSKVTNMMNMFEEAAVNATTVSIQGIGNWDTSNVDDMSWMFYDFGNNMSSFAFDLSGWDTSNVTRMPRMFGRVGEHAHSFSLNLSGWDVSKVANTYGMFYNTGTDAETYTLNVSNWNTIIFTQTDDLFSGLGRYSTTVNIDASNWKTSNITSMYGTFYAVGEEAETVNINITGWDTSNVTNIDNMFELVGASATNFSVIIPRTNGGGINNTTTTIYGSDSNNSFSLSNNKLFTLAG